MLVWSAELIMKWRDSIYFFLYHLKFLLLLLFALLQCVFSVIILIVKMLHVKFTVLVNPLLYFVYVLSIKDRFFLFRRLILGIEGHFAGRLGWFRCFSRMCTIVSFFCWNHVHLKCIRYWESIITFKEWSGRQITRITEFLLHLQGKYL